MADFAFIETLESLVRSRIQESPDNSYTAALAAKGIAAAAQKVGEEGVEVALAAALQQDAELVGESADLLFHLLVVLAMRDIPFNAVVAELQQRHQSRLS